MEEPGIPQNTVIVSDERLDHFADIYCELCIIWGEDFPKNDGKPVPFHQYLADRLTSEKLSLDMIRHKKAKNRPPHIEFLPMI